MGLLEPHGRYRRRDGETDLKLRLPKLDAHAKAEAWGMAVGFALSLYAAYRFEFGIAPFAIAWLGAWVAWEAVGALRLARVKEDAPTLALSVLIGLLIPAAALALVALLAAIKP